jgi:predicted ABC-type sugar transport system permease subunit
MVVADDHLKNNYEGACMKEIKVWPHLTIVAVVCAVLAGVGVALWMKHEQTASAEAVPNAARIQRVEGEVRQHAN